MSYDILYGKQFIKVDDNRVIPFVLIGCNNLYEADTNKRVRDWNNTYAYSEGKRMIVDNNMLLANIDKYREDTIKRCEEWVTEYKSDSWAYNDKHWGYHTSLAISPKSTRATTFGAYKSFFKNGIKEAMTIEELYDAHVTISLRVSPYYDAKEFEAMNVKVLPTVYIKTTQQLIDTIAEYEAYYAGVKSATLYISESGMEWFMRRKPKRKVDKKETKRITVKEYYVLKAINTGFYFFKNTKYGYKYSYYAISGKAFHSEAKAKAFHKRMRNKDLFTITKIEDTRSFSI